LRHSQICGGTTTEIKPKADLALGRFTTPFTNQQTVRTLEALYLIQKQHGHLYWLHFAIVRQAAKGQTRRHDHP